MTGREPTRDDPHAPASLRAGVAALSAIEPDYDVTGGLARLHDSLRSSPPPSTSSTRWAVIGGGLVAVVVGVVAFGGLDGGRERHWDRIEAVAVSPDEVAEDQEPITGPATSATMDASAEHEHRATGAGSQVPEAATMGAEPLARGAAVPAVVAVPAVPADRATHRSRRRAIESPTPTDAPTAAADDDGVLLEMRLLDRARRRLSANDGEGALAIVAEARRSVTPLQLDEEWTALEIRALAAADRLAQARPMAAAFQRAHPNGRFESAIARALADAEARAVVAP